MSGGVLPLSVLLGLGIALLIESGTQGRAFFRAVFFLPVVSLLVAMATAWEYLLHPTIGPVNRALGLLGVACRSIGSVRPTGCWRRCAASGSGRTWATS